MAAVTLDTGGLLMRLAGVFVFVLVTVPYGMFSGFVLPDDVGPASIPVVILVIIVVCLHIYLVYRAYYALKISGFLVLTFVYTLLAYYVAYLFGLEWSGSGIRWYAVAYLTLLYGYGICYNFIDSYISGLLHTKGV